MKVIVNQNIKPGIKVRNVYYACTKCFSILEVKHYDLVRNNDRYGKWYSVQCQCCGSEIGIPLALAERLAKNSEI